MVTMVTVDDDLFGKAAAVTGPLTPESCAYWVERLDAFGFWALRPEVLETALRDTNLQEDFRDPIEEFLKKRRVVPHQFGDCNVIFVLDADAALLRRSFILPFQWNPGRGHADNLPPGLLQVAEQVRADLAQDVPGQWGLSLSERAGLSCVDLSGVTDRTLRDCSSAWGGLAAGLLLASANGRPRGDVFVSAAWKPGFGLQEVKGITDKLAVAREFGCRVFYASLSREDAQRFSEDRTLSSGVQVRDLGWGERNPTAALRDLLYDLQYPPRRKDGHTFEDCCKYANRFPERYRREREEYILENIVLDQAERVRSQHPGLKDKFKTLVIIMSSPPAAVFSILVVRPKIALVLHTERHRHECEKVRQWVNRLGLECDMQGLELSVDDYQGIEREIHRFLQEQCTRPAAVDVTGGKKGMTAAAACAALRAGAAIVYVDSDYVAYRQIAGTEDLHLVRPPTGLA